MERVVISAFILTLSLNVIAQKEFVNPDALLKPSSYTHVVALGPGKTIYISGQVPVNSKGEIVGKGDLKVQVKQVYENLKLCLAAAGATFDDVVKMNTYVVNYKPEYVTTIREVRSEYLSLKNPPASTLAGVQALYHPDVMIEIEAIAIIN
jgi:enamine deaminase RidA (YjgF/YER057c/UK114 family)